MLPNTLKLYIKDHPWEPCLPVKEHQVKIPLFSSQEISCPGPPVNDSRKEKINTSLLEADQNKEMFDFIPLPLHFFI